MQGYPQRMRLDNFKFVNLMLNGWTLAFALKEVFNNIICDLSIKETDLKL